MQKSLHYRDVVLVPQFSRVRSRDEIELNGSYIIPANMATTISRELSESLGDNGKFTINHRFESYETILRWCEEMYQKMKHFSLSIGIKKPDEELISALARRGIPPATITIDVAHGHSTGVLEMISFIKKTFAFGFGNSPRIIAGNIGSSDALIDLVEAGCSGVKVGLSMGKACTTYNMTGVGTPMFSTVFDIARTFEGMRVSDEFRDEFMLIADGGIRETGDIAKALVAGATSVMAGSLFVTCVDSPTEHVNGSALYYGSASARNKGEDRYVEGNNGIWLVENGMTYLQLMEKTDQGIRSSLSYLGVKSLRELYKIPFYDRMKLYSTHNS